MSNFPQIIHQYKTDTESVYNTWFVDNDQRLKAFRTIRRGVLQVIEDIKNKTFPNDFKESSLEFVLGCIAEQKQVFVGVAHPFYWKPKLRIPDIYENQANKIAFGQFLENCINAKTEEQVIREIVKLDALKIKGLGPAVASILYFLHPRWFPPFNTAILNGFNFLFKDKKKLGSWTEYLKIRETLMETNNNNKTELSNDLGAIAGLCFEIGTQKMLIGNDEYLSETERIKLEKNILKRQKEIQEEKQEEKLHDEMQYHLLKIGISLGFDVTPASNDKSKSFCGQSFSFISMKTFPALPCDKETQTTIKLIDVYPDGRAYNLDETIQRARYRNGYDKEEFMKKRKVYKIEMTPMSTSNYFEKGHRIRIEISSSNFPRFTRNLNTGGNNFDESEGVVAINQIHHNAEYPSQIRLPIVKN